MAHDTEDITIRKLLGSRIRAARKQAGINATDISKRLDISRAAVAQWEVGKTMPTPDNLRTVSKILGVTLEWLAQGTGIALGSAVKITPEGKMVDLKTLDPNQAKMLAAAMAGRKAQVWQLTADSIAGYKGYTIGDYLIVDMEQEPQPKDIVMAEHRGVVIFRMLLPPRLFALPENKVMPSIMADGVNAVVKGVVISRISL